MVRRRSILTTIGAVAGTAVGARLPRQSSSCPGRAPTSARDAGIADEVASMFAKGEIDEATTVLEDHRVAHAVSGGPIDEELGSPQDREPEGPAIQSRYSESASAAYCTLFHLEGDRWLASGVAILSERRYRLRDAAMVPDVCALSYDVLEWASPDPTVDNLTLTASAHDVAYETYSPNYGPAATVQLTYGQYPDAVIGMQTELIRRGSHPEVPVTFTYEHTYAFANDYLDLLGVSVGAGGLSVSLPTGAYRAWKHEATARPGPGR